MMDWYGNSPGDIVWMILVMLVVWAGLLGTMFWAVSHLTRRTPGVHFESPHQILDRRLAAGEIDAESYAQARRILQRQGVDRHLHRG